MIGEQGRLAAQGAYDIDVSDIDGPKVIRHVDSDGRQHLADAVASLSDALRPPEGEAIF